MFTREPNKDKPISTEPVFYKLRPEHDGPGIFVPCVGKQYLLARVVPVVLWDLCRIPAAGKAVQP